MEADNYWRLCTVGCFLPLNRGCVALTNRHRDSLTRVSKEVEEKIHGIVEGMTGYSLFLCLLASGFLSSSTPLA